MFVDLIATLLVSLVGSIALLAAVRSQVSKREHKWMRIGCAYHIVAAWLHLWTVERFYRGGDASYYYVAGQKLRQLLVSDGTYTYEVFRLALGLSADLPFHIERVGTSTGAMSGVAAIGLLLTGDQKIAAATLFSLLAYTGLILVYLSFRHFRGPDFRAAVFTLFLPSVTFWVSGLVKESLAVTGLGLTLWGFTKLRSRLWPATILAFVGIGIVYVFKPYVLVALVTAGVFLLIQGRETSLLAQFTLSILVSGFAFFSIIYLLPDYAPDAVLAQTAVLQNAYPTLEGGSNFAYAQSGASDLGGQIRNVPLAFVSTFFRPFLFEVHNLAAALSALESTVLTYLALRILLFKNWRGSLMRIFKDPVLLFCLVFVMIFGIAVGLAAPNLGTLSRYRVPMMPFYAMLLVTLASNAKPLRKRSHGKSPTSKG